MPQLPIQLVEIAKKNLTTLRESGADEHCLSEHADRLNILLGMSDFVSDILHRYPHFVTQLFAGELLAQSDVAYADVLEQTLADCHDETSLHRILRQFRHLQMVRIAARDLLGMQSIERSVVQVSDLAESIISCTLKWLQASLQGRYGVAMSAEGPQQLLVLGMGKLGGGELNFSSDIDLIFCYAAPGNTEQGTKSLEHQQYFTRLGQKLIGALNQQTVDGQVFRVDMRLRPFGDSGPLVCHFGALEDYYQDQGREWERYAMLKARVLAAAGPHVDMLNHILKPFVYRRYLDFGVFESLRGMKALIQKEVRRRRLEHDVKLGQGGIREAEFIVQSFQLVRGGREQALQTPGFLNALTALAQQQIITPTDADSLTRAYLYLRKVEHCLQQFADQQTQALPDNETDQLRLCYAMQSTDYPTFLSTLRDHRDTVHQLFLSVVGDTESGIEPSEVHTDANLQDLWLLELSVEEINDILQHRLDNQDISPFASALMEFRQSLQRRGVGQKGLETLNELMPLALTMVLEQTGLSAAELLQRLLAVLSAIVGRTTYLQLLNEHPGALAQLNKLCAASPWISQQLQRFPMLLDELLNPVALYTPTELGEYAPELRRWLLRVAPEDLELQMETLRQFKLSQQLKIAAADVTGVLPVMKVSDHLTLMAEALIQEVVAMAWQQMTSKYGAPGGFDEHNKGFAVLGYGKLGGWELGYGSDLDLVFVHAAPAGCVTQGTKSIEAGRFYAKLAQRIMHLFSTKTGAGELYEVDMRLRPSGNAGLLVCHIDGFNKYQQQEAWTWEHQALVRARPIYGNASLISEFQAIRHSILSRHRDHDKLQRDVREMREKMRAHLVTVPAHSFDIKQGRGGIADIEFLVQFWVLNNSHAYPELTKWSDNVRILDVLRDEGLIAEQVAADLHQAYLEYRNTSHALTLQNKEIAADDQHFADLRQRVTQVWQQVLGE